MPIPAPAYPVIVLEKDEEKLLKKTMTRVSAVTKMGVIMAISLIVSPPATTPVKEPIFINAAVGVNTLSAVGDI